MNHQLIALWMILAGTVHLIIAPEHYAHAPGHGLFFVVTGTLEIGWALAFWRRPNRRLYYSGLILAGGLITLWMITRVLPAPFASSPESIDFWGVFSKTAESLTVLFLIQMMQGGQIEGAKADPIPVRAISTAILLVVFSGAALYSAGLFSEKLMPGLFVSGESETPGEERDDAHDHNH